MSFRELKIFQLCYIITFLISGIIINAIQVFLYFTLGKCNKILFGRINYYLTYSINSQITFLYAWWAGSDLTLLADSEDFHKYYGKENAFVIMNHYYSIDWLIYSNLGDSFKMLGCLRGFSKKSVLYLPPIGLNLKFSGSIFVNKSIDKDKKNIEESINYFTNYPNSSWLILHPEGTRFSKSKHEESKIYAAKNGFPLLKYHLSQRTKGFTTCLMAMRGKIDALYDLTIAFKKDAKFAPTIINVLTGRKLHAYIHITRIPLSEIPETENGASEWLRNRFVVKDKLQESFMNTGDFFAESGMVKTSAFTLHRRIYALINMIFWGAIVLIPFFKWIFQILWSGNILHISIVTGVLGTFHIILQQMIGMTIVEETSSESGKEAAANSKD